MSDRRERIGDQEEQSRLAMDSRLAGLWTALPGIIQSFNASALTCTVQPSISGKSRQPDGTVADVQLPLLQDCPVVFPGGGGCILTFPLAAGDECLVVFASRCIDSWWQLGGVKGQAEVRMHDLSDGFVIPGPRSQPRKVTAASKTQLRTDDGTAIVEIENGKVRLKGNVTVEGNLTITGTTIGNGVNLNTHRHTNVTTGPSNTGLPTSEA
jgi:hypothetical protein